MGIATLVVADAVAFGILLPLHPRFAVALACLVPLAFGVPLAALSVVLFITVLGPFGWQDSFAVVGGPGIPGLLVVDVLLILGLCRVAGLVMTGRLRLSAPLLAAGVIGVTLAAALIAGIEGGAGLSEAGHEARWAFTGVGTFLLAWPLLEEVEARRRLYRILLVLGLALGIWGIAQWLLSIAYSSTGDVGVRAGKDLALFGMGQLQGGLFAYPVAVALSWAALVSDRVDSWKVRVLLGTTLTLNAICCLLTFERTLWAATAAACLFVVIRSGPAARRTAVKSVPALVVSILLGLVVLAPTALRTAADRLFSVAQYRADPSVVYRTTEMKAVLATISDRPLTGSGFGAAITWGKESGFATTTTGFVHNAYLWLAWKIGIPAALLIALLIVGSVVKRNPGGESWRLTALRTGSKAALFALLIVSLTFLTFGSLGITGVIGLLVALCYSRDQLDPSRPDF